MGELIGRRRYNCNTSDIELDSAIQSIKELLAASGGDDSWVPGKP